MDVKKLSTKKKKVTQRKRNIPTDIQVILSKLSNKYKPIDTKLTKDTKKIPVGKFDNDFLYSDLEDLVNETYKKWYMKQFYALGRARVIQLAGIARQDGRNPAKLFAYLLAKK